MVKAGAVRFRAGCEPSQPTNDYRKCGSWSWFWCGRASANTKGERSGLTIDGRLCCPGSSAEWVCISQQASSADQAAGIRVTWWITQIERAQAERVAVANLESQVPWLEIVYGHLQSRLRLA